MKILHICLATFYIDNYAYQENLLTKYHKKIGYEVEILASQVSFDKNGMVCELNKNESYYNENGILVTRLNYKKGLFSKRLRKYKLTFENIKKANPEIIFIHGCQFSDIKYVKKYVTKNLNVKVYVDNHADYVNSAKNWLSKNILHKIVWKRCANTIEPFVEKFYGVLPARVDFIKEMYNIPANKVELLVMGADDEKVIESQKEYNKSKLRNKLNVNEEDFLIITGGKIDNGKKQILTLMKSLKKLKNDKVTLILFGTIHLDLKDEFYSLLNDINAIFVGWIKSDEVYNYFSISDLGVFPAGHSVLWEQAVGTGLPCIFKKWPGAEHVDIGGNCLFLENDSKEELEKKITYLIKNKKKVKKMKEIAIDRGIEVFSYKKIAEKSIK